MLSLKPGDVIGCVVNCGSSSADKFAESRGSDAGAVNAWDSTTVGLVGLVDVSSATCVVVDTAPNPEVP